MNGNAILQATTTTGAGNLTLAAVTGYAEFNDDPVFATGGRFGYTIRDSNGYALEWGIGYLSSSTVMVREKVLGTLSSGTLDNTSPAAASLAAGNYTVICSPLAELMQCASPGPNRNTSLNLQRFAYSTHMTFASSLSTGVTMVANRLYMMPFRLECRAEVDAIGLRVGTGAASSNVRMGIWDIQADGHPGKLLGETSALASTSSGVDVIGTLASPITLSPGWYYVGVVSDGIPAVGRATQGSETFAFLGSAAGNLMQGTAAFYATHTFGAMPNPAPATSLTAMNTNTACPAIGLRCA